MTRKHDWELHLFNFFLDSKATDFEYGVQDCGLFSANAIEAITGIDVGKPFRELNYESLLGASKAIMQVTGTGHSIKDALEHIVRTHDLEECPVLFAQRGDLILWEGEEGYAAGIIGMDAKNVTFAGSAGLRKVSVRLVSKTNGRAWRVGPSQKS